MSQYHAHLSLKLLLLAGKKTEANGLLNLHPSAVPVAEVVVVTMVTRNTACKTWSLTHFIMKN